MGNRYHRERGATPAPPQGCPVHETWSPLNADYIAAPYVMASELSKAHPIFYSAQLGYLVVTRMEDLEEIFRDHESYSSALVQDPAFPLDSKAQEVLSAKDFDPVAVMSNRAEPEHGIIRRYTRKGFSNKRIKTLEPFIERRGNQLIDEMLSTGGPTELVDAFAFPLPGETVFRFIGFPESDDELLKNWCGDRKAFSWGKPTAEQQVEIAEHMLAYWRYCREFTASKRDNRGDDFTSELIDGHEANPQDISYKEVESVVYGLSFAGHEAVTALLCNSLLSLLPRRDLWEQICADTSLIPNALEEVLRYNSSQISWRRITTEDTHFRGYDIPAGTRVFLNFASANRQEEIFEDPHTFDIHRKNANRHISFGKGVHHCLGSKFARTETHLMLKMLAERIPSLRLAEGFEPEYFPNITFRGPNTLMVDWDNE